MKDLSLNSERGSMLSELTLTLPIFLAVMIGGFEILRLSYNNVAVQIIASRGVFIAGPLPCKNGSCNGPSGTVNQALNGLAGGLGVTGGGLVVCLSAGASAGNCMGASPTNSVVVGNPRQLFVVRARKRIPLVFGLGAYTVDALAIGRHEPWS